ncbi:MAG: tRNA (cytidine(34)-2'-O)-methyltransferase [Firmicutes bacterium]|nr:tRNA (cytidine(34)-2'-O)-methyltransferase [Bacillota bacterium]
MAEKNCTNANHGNLHIALVNPEIPPNTGNIARLCAATGCTLNLIRPLGFFLDDKHLKRAGLDYWELVTWHLYDSVQELEAHYPDSGVYYVTTKGKTRYSDIRYQKGDVLVFGSETKGLPKEVLDMHPERCVRIPMASRTKSRSLNLSNAAAIVLFEALRQLGFCDLM